MGEGDRCPGTGARLQGTRPRRDRCHGPRARGQAPGAWGQGPGRVTLRPPVSRSLAARGGACRIIMSQPQATSHFPCVYPLSHVSPRLPHISPEARHAVHPRSPVLGPQPHLPLRLRRLSSITSSAAPHAPLRLSDHPSFPAAASAQLSNGLVPSTLDIT